ncbi:hypothetical protein BDZ91DRAFT_728090 [Kalaharituber pfeilii]|nr:hypothetical protein BDZ91DRAFT_728090 [Kalaharituber pfeilii]
MVRRAPARRPIEDEYSLEINTLARQCERLIHKAVNDIMTAPLTREQKQKFIAWVNQEVSRAGMAVLRVATNPEVEVEV